MGKLADSFGGAVPWGAFGTAGLGLIQTLGGRIQARRAEGQLENLQSPAYAPNQGILDYYQKALQKYNTSPYDTLQYKTTVNNAQRGTATGLDALSGRGGAVAGVSNLIANQDNNLLNAATQGEKQKANEFNVLGRATSLKAGEESKAFKINQLDPFERKYNLLAMKASGGNKIEGAGISNIFQGLNAYDDLRSAAADRGAGIAREKRQKKTYKTGMGNDDDDNDTNKVW